MGKVRPLSSQAAYALEQAVANDVSTRVRLTARTALWQYHLAGFRGSNPPPAGPQTNEPPLAQSGPRPLWLVRAPAPARSCAGRFCVGSDSGPAAAWPGPSLRLPGVPCLPSRNHSDGHSFTRCPPTRS